MTAVEDSPSPSGEVVDLRLAPADVSDAPTVEVDADVRLRRRRSIIIGAALAVVALIAWDFVAGRVVHDQRQRHLAFDVTQPKRSIADGEASMILQIPRLGINTVVVEGASVSELRNGPGHVRGTAAPGERGNVVVVGHRMRYAGPFGDLGSLKQGDQIAVKTRAGLVRGYSVDRVRRVDAGSRMPLVASTDERLTLVTSAAGFLPDRVVVVTANVAAGPEPTRLGGRFAPARGALDERPVSGPVGALFLLLVLACMVVAIVVGGGELRRRYSPLTTTAVLVPVVGLLALVLVFSLDTVLPATF